jgi:hypothetical protein
MAVSQAEVPQHRSRGNEKRLSEPFHSKCTFRLLLTPFELAPAARAVIGDNGLKKVQQGARVDGFILTDLNRPCCQVPLSLVNNALGIGHDGVVDENVDMVLRSEQRADIAMQRKTGLLGSLDGLGHLRVDGVYQLSHLAAHLLLPARKSVNVVVDARVGLVCTHAMMIPRIKVRMLG